MSIFRELLEMYSEAMVLPMKIASEPLKEAIEEIVEDNPIVEASFSLDFLDAYFD